MVASVDEAEPSLTRCICTDESFFVTLQAVQERG